MDITIDIETIPRVKPTKEDLKAPGNYTKAESIVKYIDDNYDELMEKEVKARSTSLYDAKIVCISYAIDDEKPQSIVGTEKEILSILNTTITDICSERGMSVEAAYLIGHNIKAFDAPMIWLRACLYNLPTLKKIFFPNRKLLVDTMELCAAGQYKVFISLDKALKFFGIGEKGSTNGADVFPMYERGEIEEISRYCCEDVSKTRDLHQKLNIYGE